MTFNPLCLRGLPLFFQRAYCKIKYIKIKENPITLNVVAAFGQQPNMLSNWKNSLTLSYGKRKWNFIKQF